MVNLIGNFSRLDRQKVLVAGDLMLDTYTIGKARRISPEAPVAVIDVEKTEERAGGAGNTILNLISMGACVIALGRVGADIAGKTLFKALQSENVDVSGIFEESTFKTPLKNRIIADNQQIVRVDHEEIKPLGKDLEDEIINKLPSILKDVQAVAISDYGKGFLSNRLLKALIKTARELNIFIIADPKGTDFTRYTHVNLIKPNLKEAFLAAHLDPSSSLDQVAKKLLNEISVDYLMVTRSEDGISLFEKDSLPLNFPVRAKQVKDVTGAGDTVLAMLTLAIANKLPLPIAIQFSNLAAGLAIEQFGCARITLAQLAKRLLEFDVSNKIFDGDHLHTLQAALKDHPHSFIAMKNHQALTPAEINALAAHKKKTGEYIVASFESAPSEELIDMLKALQPIDFILIKSSAKS